MDRGVLRRLKNMGMDMRPIALISYGVCIIFILLPLLSLVFSGDVEGQVLRNKALAEALAVSAKSTVLMMLTVILLGTPAAYAYARVPFKGKSLVNVVMDIPLVLPPAVAGLLLLMTFGRRGLAGAMLYDYGIQLPFSLAAVIVAQVFVGLPIYIKTVAEGFAAVDEHLELTAMTLGDSRFKAFRRITLPLSSGSIYTGAIMAWARGLAEFGATIMFAGNLRGRTQTLPLAIYSAMESDMGVALGIAQIMVGLSVGLLLIVHLVVKGRREYV